MGRVGGTTLPSPAGEFCWGREGEILACPWHGFMYDVRTGECVLPRRGHRVASYPVRIDAGEVWVEVP